MTSRVERGHGYFSGAKWSQDGEDLLIAFERIRDDVLPLYRDPPDETYWSDDPLRAATAYALRHIQTGAVIFGMRFGADWEASKHAAKASAGNKICHVWADVAWKWEERRRLGDSFRDADNVTALHFACSWRFIQNLRLKAGVRSR